MTTLIASTVFAFAGLQAPPQNPPALIGPIRSAPVLADSVHLGALNASGNVAKAIDWSTVTVLSPGKTRFANNYLIFYRPACVDCGGIADMMGMPGGWHSEPGDDQSYLLTFVATTIGKRYGLVFEISRYTENSGPAEYEIEHGGAKRVKNLTGPGYLYYSFIAKANGREGVFLRMKSKGRYLFRGVEIRVANL